MFPITFHIIIVSQHNTLYRVKVLGRTKDVLFVMPLSLDNDVLKLPRGSPVTLEFELGDTFYIKMDTPSIK